ncbi:aspartyl protease family protein [Pelomonas sp. V22]|uniref:aspartyl protease family protein n=1 Tax=Pelomonas sp. V22 TaxID=2822139 RepID=UPI0024A8EC1E|nr:aspartyl protease family protein [Pelomonas sp. V22]MDI4635472.1 aspartyl protease family protein [Pelomonas sp. V22]
MTEPLRRIEPGLGTLDGIPINAEEPSFMNVAREREQRPGALLWMLAVGSVIAVMAWNLAFNLPENAGVGYAFGAVIGSLFLPGLVLGTALVFDSQRGMRSCLKVVSITCAAVLLMLCAHLLTVRGYGQRWFNHEQLTAADFERLAMECARARDLRCEESNWRDYLRLRPDDARGAAWLGRTLNRRGKDAEAIIEFQRAIAAGSGGYDMFAFYGDSLQKLGRNDEAIKWFYRSLSVDARQVDVRGKLAELLVAARRPYEAISLLQAYDESLESHGRPAYFSAQRMSIESILGRGAGSVAPELASLRVPMMNGHYFVPVTIAEARPWPFVLDTGASVTTLSERLLQDSKALYRVVDPDAQMRTADGRKVTARAIVIDTLRVGPFELTNVPAVVCADCVPLLGQATLSRFDLRSERVQGTDFIWLTARASR